MAVTTMPFRASEDLADVLEEEPLGRQRELEAGRLDAVSSPRSTR